MGPLQLLLHGVRVDLGVIVIKGYSIFPKHLKRESHYQKQFNVISSILGGWLCLTLRRNAIKIFHRPNWLCWDRFFFFFRHIKLCGLFNAQAIFLEQQGWYLTNSWVHTFPKGISAKVNAIARLEFELTYYDSASPALLPLNHEDTPPVLR